MQPRISRLRHPQQAVTLERPSPIDQVSSRASQAKPRHHRQKRSNSESRKKPRRRAKSRADPRAPNRTPKEERREQSKQKEAEENSGKPITTRRTPDEKPRT